MRLDELKTLPPTLSARQVADLFEIGINQVYFRARDGEFRCSDSAGR